ncbi:MAG: hypothetical protein K0A99_02555 [Desulfoarculaceae bacterium]|nr:hypothetical protein [Desulfoarculaceae bacterium]
MPLKNKYRSPANRLVGNGLFIVMLLVNLLAAPTGIHAAPLESFLLFYSNNIQGETEPCG